MTEEILGHFYSDSLSIRANKALGFIFNASLIFQKVSNVGLLSPRSMALKCVLPIPARPLITSWDFFCSSRTCCMTRPTTFASNIAHAPFTPFSVNCFLRFYEYICCHLSANVLQYRRGDFMDYSIRGYLGRQPTKTLETMLHHYLQDGMWEDYFYIIPMILEVLTQRGFDLPQQIYDRIAEIETLRQE